MILGERWLSAAVGVGLVASGCGVFGGSRVGPAATAAPGVPVAAPPGAYIGLAWLPGDWLVTGYESGHSVPELTWRLWRVRSDGTALERLSLPDDPGCAQTRY